MCIKGQYFSKGEGEKCREEWGVVGSWGRVWIVGPRCEGSPLLSSPFEYQVPIHPITSDRRR